MRLSCHSPGRVTARAARPAAVRVTLALLALFVALPLAAAAAPATWLVPAGGEVWTAGTTHTIEWSGGDPTVTVVAFFEQFSPFGSAPLPNLAYFANNGTASWSIPAGFLPGTYKLAIAFPSGATYSEVFTIQAPPTCLTGCQPVSASFPAIFPPGTALPIGACANSAAAAASLAHQFVYAQLSGQCFAGFTLDPGSVVIDVTVLPIGACYGGYTGSFIAEASGLGCCCPDPVATTPQSWGTLKSQYR